jgi:hypothetical protein
MALIYHDVETVTTERLRFDSAVLEAMRRMHATLDVLERSPAVVQQMN